MTAKQRLSGDRTMTAEQKLSIESASSQPMLAQGGGWPSEEEIARMIHAAWHGDGSWEETKASDRERELIQASAVLDLFRALSTPREWKIPEGMKPIHETAIPLDIERDHPVTGDGK